MFKVIENLENKINKLNVEIDSIERPLKQEREKNIDYFYGAKEVDQDLKKIISDSYFNNILDRLDYEDLIEERNELLNKYNNFIELYNKVQNEINNLNNYLKRTTEKSYKLYDKFKDKKLFYDKKTDKISKFNNIVELKQHIKKESNNK